jgi:D-alanine-D-alanine ligase-like ATP-grasp enzyme
MSAKPPNILSNKSTIRVAVLCPSYGDSDSVLKAFDDFETSPALFFAPRWPPSLGNPLHTAEGAHGPFVFETVLLDKKTVYKTLRGLVKANKYDVYFNLCDGAKDEDRAGEDVVRTLEELGVPFTGATSACYEPSKPEMKFLASLAGIRTARSAVVDRDSDIAAACDGLKFPVIIKHMSGYASIGMTQDVKCYDMPALVKRASAFIDTFEAALVEEFVTGIEATVLAVADPDAPDGIRVYDPVAVDFPGGAGDFKHFDLKWKSADDMQWKPVPHSSPAYDKMMDVGRKAFKAVMGGVGYGRSDVRVDEETGEVVFLEINPNCGILYPPGSEGSADWVLAYAGPNGAGHREFISKQIQHAIDRCAAAKPPCSLTYDLRDNAYVMKAERRIPANTHAWQAQHGPRVVFAGELATKEGEAMPSHLDWRPLIHTTEPNTALRLTANGTRALVALRDIEAGEKLTLNFMCPSGAASPEATAATREHADSPTSVKELSDPLDGTRSASGHENDAGPLRKTTAGALQDDASTAVTSASAYVPRGALRA